MTRLAVTIAGLTTDFATFWQHNIQGTGPWAPWSPTRWASATPSPAAMPITANGLYAVAMEGYTQITGGERYAMRNPMLAFAGDRRRRQVPRRDIITSEHCNSCHGGTRGARWH
ncbi:MAG: hypothetical protein IPG04_40645 [Polyangiaceae bacterium]|nr:hypothetical protein [Polyangiaceae bacterium]